MSGKTDIRWSDGEWAALTEYAGVVCGTPGKAVKWVVCQHLREVGLLAQEVGSAAPREGGVVGLRREVMSNGAGLPVAGAASGLLEPAKRSDEATVERSAMPGAAAEPVPAWPRPSARDLMAELQASFERQRVVDERNGVPWPNPAVGPVGSAGSGAPDPPAGGAAAESDLSAAAPPEGVRLLDAVVAALRGQGVVNGVELMARKAIRSGGVVVDGEACRDPERLVDPASLGQPT